jgi:hypothetical protein
LKYTSGADASVPASIATHMSPRWWDTMMSDIAPRKASSAAQKTRL